MYCSQCSLITQLRRRPAVLESIHTLVSFAQLLPESCKWATVKAERWSPASGSWWGLLISGSALEEDISSECKKTRWCQTYNKITTTLVSFRWIKSVIPQTHFLSRFLIWPSPIWSQRGSGCWQNQQSLGCSMFPTMGEVFFMVTWKVAEPCSLHRELATGTCSPSAVLSSVKKAPTGKLQCLYILGCELGATTKE